MRAMSWLVILAFGIGTTGCATSPAKRQAAGLAGVAGAIVGGAVGLAKTDTDREAEGLAIGTFFGALVGGALGQAIVNEPPEMRLPRPDAPADEETPEDEIAAARTPGLVELKAEELGGDPARGRSAVFYRVHFDFDESEIRSEDAGTLREVSEVLLGNPGMRLTVTGHADAIGSFEYNQALSERRAEAVKRYLLDHGVNAGRISTHGLGELDPVAPNTRPDGSDHPEGRAMNRRADIEDTKEAARN